MKTRRYLLALLLALPGCSDPAKVSEEAAVKHTDELAALAEKDVGEIRRGLPLGGKKIAEVLYEGDTKEVTPGRARIALRRTREAVTDLQLAKSTFFAVTDVAGVAYANDQETDAMSGKNLLAAFPALRGATTGSYVESAGIMEEARGTKSGDDAEWVAAAPVVGKDGVIKGAYVTGWSLRRFAYHLEEQLKSNFRQDAAKSGKPLKQPLVYAFVIRGLRAYSALVTPEVNQKAVEGLGLEGKLPAEGTWHDHIDITGRTFGIAGRRVKALCDTCAVVVIRSEV